MTKISRNPRRPSPAQQLLARNLRRLRKERGLSQEELAAKAGIDPAAVDRLEQCQEDPKIDTLEQLALALGVPFVTLIAK